MNSSPMYSQPLLIELFTEELPPKALWRLTQALSDHLVAALKQHQLLANNYSVHPFATPRRLAVRIEGVYNQQPDGMLRRRGPAVATALTPEGQPTPALLGFLRSCSATLEALTLEEQNGQAYFFYEAAQQGRPLSTLLSDIVDTAIKKLPIPKTMRWGSCNDSFVRPVHRLVVLHGSEIIPAQILGLMSGRDTEGHRFFAKTCPISIDHAHHYEKILEQQGFVIADYSVRRDKIVELLVSQKEAGENIIMPEALIDEVCGLVEYPVVLRGHFEAEFLSVPKEVLILSMQTHQRYFAIEESTGQLKSSFLLISNSLATDPSHIINGNERVLRARLSDARFFYEQDLKVPLRKRAEQLQQVIYHQKLGSQAERVERVKQLAKLIYRPFSEAWSLNEQRLEEAVEIAKADLSSDMVGEFPELQGVIGSYYAAHEGRHPHIVSALREQYQLKFDHLTLAIHPGSALSQEEQREGALLNVILRVADRLETLAGLFGIGLIPTGDKDPYALRRCAMVILDALEWLCQQAKAGWLAPVALPTLKHWIDHAWTLYKPGMLTAHPADLMVFVQERMRQRLTQQWPHTVVDAVLRSRASLAEARLRVEALAQRSSHPSVLALAQAHKRIQNLLKKADHSNIGEVNNAYFQHPAEEALWQAMLTLQPQCVALLNTLAFNEAVDTLAQLAEPVDRFFNDVMIMVEEPALRSNRLALLAALNHLLFLVADLAMLA